MCLKLDTSTLPGWMQVRREAARSASSAMSAQANTCSPSANVEHVERMAFNYMSRSFGDLPQYHEQIRHWIYKPTSNQLLDSSWQPGAVHKLFEKELDNHHEERLLIAQLASQQLVQLLQGPGAGPLSSQQGADLKQWVLGCLKVSLAKTNVKGMGCSVPSCPANSCARLFTCLKDIHPKASSQGTLQILCKPIPSPSTSTVQELAAMSSCLAELQPRTAWLGGLTNHPDAFSPLYHMLLGVHSAAACISGDELLHASAAAAVQQAAEALLACGVQPLIGNLLNKVTFVRIHALCGEGCRIVCKAVRGRPTSKTSQLLPPVGASCPCVSMFSIVGGPMLLR